MIVWCSVWWVLLDFAFVPAGCFGFRVLLFVLVGFDACWLVG